MSILLTDDEVSILLHENTFLTDGDFARAIQLALIEKIRKEPDDYLYEYVNYYGKTVLETGVDSVDTPYKPVPIWLIPTAQELENER